MQAFRELGLKEIEIKNKTFEQIVNIEIPERFSGDHEKWWTFLQKDHIKRIKELE